MKQAVWYPVSNMALPHAPKDVKLPIIHLIVQHGTTGAHFSQAPDGDQQRVPRSSGIEHPCNFILDNKLPVLKVESFSQASSTCWNRTETKHPAPRNYRHCVQNPFPSFPLDLLLFGFFVCLSVSLLLREENKRVSVCLLNTIPYFPSTSHVMSFCLPPFLYSSLLFLGGVTPPSQLLQISWHISGLFCFCFLLFLCQL